MRRCRPSSPFAPFRRPARWTGLLASVAILASPRAYATPPASVPAPPVAPAPPPATSTATLGDALSGQAKADYLSARTLYGDRDWAGALVKFQHAYDVSHDPRLLWNAAACEKNLRHYARVLQLVERYETEGGTLLTPQDHADARTLTEAVRPLVSAVLIEVNQAGASVFVDDTPVGTTPILERFLVDLGTRHFRVTKAGFKDKAVTQEVAGASELTLRVTLEPQPVDARLTITASSEDAIAVDGKVVGQARWEGRVAPGAHDVRVTASAKKPYIASVELGAGESRALSVTLDSESHGLGAAFWVVSSVVVAAGLGVGGYFLFRPSNDASGPALVPGTMEPGTVRLPLRR